MQSPDPLESTMVFSTAPARPARAEVEEMGHYLLILEGGQAGQRFEIGDQPLILGREAGCGLVLPDGQVSRRHCSVELRFETAILTDLGSTNGTYVAGTRISQPFTLTEGLVFTLGEHVLQYERRNRRETKESQDLDRALAKASSYVHSLLPARVAEGSILTDWFYLPCERLGGDAFGYYRLDDENFVGYIVDVSGHGVAAAMHSVSLLNVLRQRALPETDFTDPGQVLRKLNRMFPMDQHDDMYFTMWYGVFNIRTRVLQYASAGHHAGFLVPAQRADAEPIPVQCRGPLIGMVPDFEFRSETATVPEGATLYLFSDGVFEIITHAGQEWNIDEFKDLLCQPHDPVLTEPERLHAHVRSLSRSGPFDDDFSILTVTFH
jgi:serine phosphatase RsbU (regulator of sigma subunit)